MTDRELMQQALDALHVAVSWGTWLRGLEAVEALRNRLAQPEQEPVACIGTNGELMWLHKPHAIYSKARPLYTAPPQRKPLTEEEMRALWKSHGYKSALCMRFARAIERAHGIGEKE